MAVVARTSRVTRQTGTMPPQFFFAMRDLRRVYPPDREVLRGINLSSYPGAQIRLRRKQPRDRDRGRHRGGAVIGACVLCGNGGGNGTCIR